MRYKAKSILKDTASSSAEDQLKALETKLHDLDQIKERAEQLYFEGRSKRIDITYFDPALLRNLHNAIHALRNSKKCRALSDGLSKDFFLSKEPEECYYFDSSTAPVVLNFGALEAHCYPQIILLFEDDFFVGATNPEGLKITVTKKEVHATFDSDQNVYLGRECLGSDSFVVQKGRERITWLHTCKDGSPDLRYSHNPAMHFRADVVRYGLVEFSIGEYKAEFAFSSHQAYEELLLAQRTYCTNNPAITDPIPTLLELFENLGADKNIIKEMRGIQTFHSEKALRVCRIIGSREKEISADLL